MLRFSTAVLLTTLLVASVDASESTADASCLALASDGCSTGTALLQTHRNLGKLSVAETEFALGGVGLSCSDAGMVDVAESDCEAACQIEAVAGLEKGPHFKGFKKGSWRHTFPKCFVVVSGPWQGNCHWNKDASAKFYTNERNRAVCRSAEGDAAEEEAPTTDEEEATEPAEQEAPTTDEEGATEPAEEEGDAAEADVADTEAPAPYDGPIVPMLGGQACQQLCVMQYAGKCAYKDTSPGKARLVKDRTGCMSLYSWAKDGGMTPCVINRGGKCHKNVNRGWKCREYTSEQQVREACIKAGAGPDKASASQKDPWKFFD